MVQGSGRVWPEWASADLVHTNGLGADHGAVERAERGEQDSGAVTLVIVRHGLAAPGLDRQSGLGAVERLDLALFRRARAPRRGPADRHRARRCRPVWRQSWDRASV